MHHLEEHHIFLFLVQFFLLLFLSRLGGEWLKRRGQPALAAELLVGILLGPTVLGRFFPAVHRFLFPSDATQQHMLETVAWIGVLFLLLEVGLEIDFSVAWRQRGPALTIAFSDILIPMVVAFIPAFLLPDRYLADPNQRFLFALFIATAMTISAMPVTARVLQELHILKAEVGYLIMSALVINDLIGWVIFTMVLGLYSREAIQLGYVGFIFLFTVGFTLLALTIGRKASTKAVAFLQQKRYPEPSTSLTFASLVGLLFGAITQAVGIHALFGFFIAGVVVGEARTLSQEMRHTLSQMVHSLFIPVFFASIGLKIDLVASFDPFLILLITGVGILGRYIGAWLGVVISRADVRRHVVAIAHTPGGVMEIVAAFVAYEAGLITSSVFVGILFGAVISSILIGPWMKAALRREASVSIPDLVTKERVLLDLRARNPEEAIRCLIRRLPATFFSETHREALQRELLTREAAFPTSLGEGVAVPHHRMEGLSRPLLVFGRSRKGIPWDAPDGKPVHFVFFIITPMGRADVHVRLLAEIARVMASSEVRQRLLEAATLEDMIHTLKAAFASSVRPVFDSTRQTSG